MLISLTLENFFGFSKVHWFCWFLWLFIFSLDFGSFFDFFEFCFEFCISLRVIDFFDFLWGLLISLSFLSFVDFFGFCNFLWFLWVLLRLVNFLDPSSDFKYLKIFQIKSNQIFEFIWKFQIFSNISRILSNQIKSNIKSPFIFSNQIKSNIRARILA